ncbi:MAG TPA: amino acid ABC transporter permease [Firmicutes bacterium]|nr:amino acid ABC transporter permease [Bacillota bacterium]
MPEFQFDYLFEVFPKIIKFLPFTFELALVSMVFATILGLILALIRQYRVKVLYQLSAIYISYFRGVPFIAQLFLFYYGVSQIVPFLQSMTPVTGMVVVLSTNAAAFMAESIRGALNSVDKGQYEAALAVGMKPIEALRRIVVPQAVRVAVPALSNSFIDLFKTTSMGFTIGLKDMMAAASIEISLGFRNFEVYVVLVAIYWSIVSILSFFQSKLEKRLNAAY